MTSVSIFAAFFGHEIQSVAFGFMAFFKAGKSRLRAAGGKKEGVNEIESCFVLSQAVSRRTAKLRVFGHLSVRRIQDQNSSIRLDSQRLSISERFEYPAGIPLLYGMIEVHE